MTMFEGNDLNLAMGVPFFYGICEAVMVGSYCIAAWKMGWSKAPADAPLWKVIVTSYEVLQAEKQEFDEIEVSPVSHDSSDSKENQVGRVFTTYFELMDPGQSAPKEGSGPLVVDESSTSQVV